MSTYGVAFIFKIEPLDCFTVQKWYADNDNAVGSHDKLKKLFFSLKKHCLDFGYQLTKCQFSNIEDFFESTQQTIEHDEVEIVDGCRVRGTVIESDYAKTKLWKDF